MISSVIREIMENHSAALQLYARQWCENPDDCLQEVLIRIAQREDVPENWVPWLYRVVKNQAISMRRKSNRRVKHEQAAGQQRESWFSELECGEFDAADVSNALELLPEKNREVITMKIWGSLTFEQISDSVECSVSTAFERYQFGLNELKKRLNGKLMLKSKMKSNSLASAEEKKAEEKKAEEKKVEEKKVEEKKAEAKKAEAKKVEEKKAEAKKFETKNVELTSVNLSVNQ